MFSNKKFLALTLILVLLVGLFPVEIIGQGIKAVPTSSKVFVNGKEVSFDSYTIGGSNYFKLRDIAYALNGTKRQFNVVWDNSKKAINLITNEPYKPVGGEMAKGDGQLRNHSGRQNAIQREPCDKVLQYTSSSFGVLPLCQKRQACKYYFVF